MHKNAKIFEIHLNPVMMVFIGELLLRALRWIHICQGFSHFSGFLHHFVLAKLATSSIKGWYGKQLWVKQLINGRQWTTKVMQSFVVRNFTQCGYVSSKVQVSEWTSRQWQAIVMIPVVVVNFPPRLTFDNRAWKNGWFRTNALKMQSSISPKHWSPTIHPYNHSLEFGPCSGLLKSKLLENILE